MNELTLFYVYDDGEVSEHFIEPHGREFITISASSSGYAQLIAGARGFL